jgi:hypothetical protein
MKPITDIMREVRRGRGVELASDMLAEVVRAVGESGKKGSVTIKLTVSPEDGGGSQRNISMSVTSSVPRVSIPDAVFFADEEGDLHRSDPDQGEMFTDSASRMAG